MTDPARAGALGPGSGSERGSDDRVSVVIPTYNHASSLANAIRSVLSQEVAAYEIIVIDDGSSDDTEAACRTFGERVRYVRQENRGVSAARNRGIALADGEFVAFLDSDDTWVPEKLAVQLRAHREFPEAGWSISDALLTREGIPTEHAQRAFEHGFPVFRRGQIDAASHFNAALRPATIEMEYGTFRVYFGDVFNLLFSGNFIFPSCSLVRRSLFASAGGFDESLRVAEDTEFFHRLAAVSPCVVIFESLVHYRLGGEDALTHGRNTVDSVRTALGSLASASLRRAPSMDGIRRKQENERDLLSRLAYAYLSELRLQDARSALKEMRRRRMKRSLREHCMYAATWIPSPLLAAAAALRHLVRRQ